MVKGCLMALLLGMAFSAQAIMVAWKVPAQNDWFLQPGNVDVYLVSSQSKDATWTATEGKWSADIKKNSGWSQVPSVTSSKNYGSSITGDSGKAYIWANVGNDKNLSVDSYYSLVFVVKSGEDAGNYAITQGKQYTGNFDSSGKGENGYYVTANEGTTPPWVDFVDADWLYANIKGAPEPTALALLAFGLAGLALRRRVSL